MKVLCFVMANNTMRSIDRMAFGCHFNQLLANNVNNLRTIAFVAIDGQHCHERIDGSDGNDGYTLWPLLTHFCYSYAIYFSYGLLMPLI